MVSYTNTIPFQYGITQSGISNDLIILKDIPSACASKILNGKVDIGIVPVAMLPHIRDYEIFTDYCIGATKEVDTVVLLSEVPIEKIQQVLLDYQSKTSVALVRILFNSYWKVQPQFITANVGYENEICGAKAGVVIGDRVFDLQDKYPYSYDLSAYWYAWQQLPFVFACWVVKKGVGSDVKKAFNNALRYGVENIDHAIVENVAQTSVPQEILSDYLNNAIEYHLDEAKKEGLKKFLSYL